MKHIPLLLLVFIWACSPQPRYDLVILNGNVHGGDGQDPQIMDIGIIGDSIVTVGKIRAHKTAQVIDAQGLEVAPGFIDLHAHLDPIYNLPECESMLRQGVTTALGGPDGGGPLPMGKHLDTLELIGTGMNVAYLVGHNSIRKQVMGLDDRAPTATELSAMKGLVEQGMQEGAFGMSTGLKYLPGAFSKTDELVALSASVGLYGGIYTSHLREEGLGIIESVYEALEIGRKANIPVVLTHHKVMGKPMWGKSVTTLAMVDSARNRGIDVMMDQYPYPASHTGIAVLIPTWCRAGGAEAFAQRLQDPVLRDSIKAGIIHNLLNDRGGSDLRRVQFAKVSWDQSLEGQTLHDWCVSKDLEPTLENGAELVIEAQLNGGANCIYFAMDTEDVRRIMQHPMTMVASDGRLVVPGSGHPHPRWYGTFPRVLGQYVRDSSFLELKTAIYKMTGQPAQRLGLQKRGLIKAGSYADIVVFDKEAIKDESTFIDPHHYPTGIHFVLVNGQVTLTPDGFEDVRVGKVLRMNEEE